MKPRGLLHRSNCVYEILRQIQIDLAPIEIVFGVGLGKLSTDIGDYAIGADGPAFHFARAALSQAKSERKEYGKSILREVKFQSDDSVPDTGSRTNLHDCPDWSRFLHRSWICNHDEIDCPV